MDEALVRNAEEQLLRIPDVVAVAIDHSDQGIDAIHVLAEDLRRPKLIVRDVVSTLRTVFNLTVDHKKVSVVSQGAAGGRSAGHAPGRPAEGARSAEGARLADGARPAEGPRLTVVSLALRESQAGAEAEVVLGLAGRETMGTARGFGGALRRVRLVAEATCRSLERFLDEGHRVEVSEVRDVSLGGRRAIVVMVAVVSGCDEWSLVGVAWADDDVNRAAVHAVLDAVNRLFGRLPARERVDYEVGPADGREFAAS